MQHVLLNSFAAPLRVAVIGASGGIGGAFAEILCAHENVAALHTFARQTGHAAHDCQHIDIENESTIEAAAAHASRSGPLDLILVATGILHDGNKFTPEKTYKAVDPVALERLYRVNAVGPALVAKHFLPHLTRGRKAVFAVIGARVGSIGDNRLGGWYGYRMSKSALVMLVKNLALEEARRNPQAICVALHPGTVDTALSEPFQRSVSGRTLFSPERSAINLLGVINSLTIEQSGQQV
ncbi:MAG: SDR family NAD(P)-dependent oxidoreductase, partial [Proteobacteria bacterium]|nr:SDR family NAD(P)-dependent oxidoreductase [Pseudomonadota bacterium]